MKKIILSIDGMTCSACSSGLEKYLNKQECIHDAIVNLVMATASIECDDDTTLEDLNKYVDEAGFKSLGIYNPENVQTKKKSAKKYLIIYGLLSILMMYISMSHMINLPSIPFFDKTKNPINFALILFVITCFFLIYGFDILKNGYKNLIHKTPNMDTLVGIGVLSSFVYSVFNTIFIILGDTSLVNHLYYESSSVVIFFIKFGRYVDSFSKDKTKEAIEKLVTITPESAILKTKTGEKEITLDEIKKNDILISKPGNRIAVDGEVTYGSSHLDESFITGESLPVKKEVGDKVIAGSINYDGYIEYKAINIGRNSTISQIVRLVVEASNTKAPISRIADKVSSYFVPCIIGIAILTLIISLIITKSFDTSLNTFVSILVVACPCALGLATPLAIIVSQGLCASNGLLVKSSTILENASSVDTIIFDKTGTLTYGNLKISKIYNYSDYTDKELLSYVATLEQSSTHPIAQAFTGYKALSSKIKDFKNLPGLGIKGTIKDKEFVLGNAKIISKYKLKNTHQEDEDFLTHDACSIIYIVENKKIIGLIGIKDIIRKEALSTIKKLKSLGKEIIMLSGDNETTANIIAKSLNINKVIAGVVPSGKADTIKKLQSKGQKVMMVGDGINDAPSLTISDIGISIGSGTDIASDSASVILLSNDLRSIIDLLTISKKTITNIKQNLFWAFFYNICMIPIAIGILKPIGITLNPMLASLAMMISSLTVVFNALRLRYIKLERKD